MLPHLSNERLQHAGITLLHHLSNERLQHAASVPNVSLRASMHFTTLELRLKCTQQATRPHTSSRRAQSHFDMHERGRRRHRVAPWLALTAAKSARHHIGATPAAITSHRTALTAPSQETTLPLSEESPARTRSHAPPTANHAALHI